MGKKGKVAPKKFRTEQLKAEKKVSPVVISLCIFFLLLIILPSATIMWFSEGTKTDNEASVENGTVGKQNRSNLKKERSSNDINSIKEAATIKSPAIEGSGKAASSVSKEAEGSTSEEELVGEYSEVIENSQTTDEEIKPVEPPVVAEYHTVQEGEGLWRIAKNNNLTLEEIKNLNNLNSDVIQVGQVLVIK